MKIKCFKKTDIGKKRNQNQDSILANEDLGLYIVADGMGGHAGGEIASSKAIDSLNEYFSTNKFSNDIEVVGKAIKFCNKTVHDLAISKNLVGMGTTVTMCVCSDSHIYIGQVGDSRCYLFSDNRLFQVTEDHSQVYELLKAGIISEDNQHLVQKNVITRSVGFESEVTPDKFIHPLKSGDKYLLCSDGLSGMVADLDIQNMLINLSGQNCVDELVKLANLNGGEDNISVIIIEVQ